MPKRDTSLSPVSVNGAEDLEFLGVFDPFLSEANMILDAEKRADTRTDT